MLIPIGGPNRRSSRRSGTASTGTRRCPALPSLPCRPVTDRDRRREPPVFLARDQRKSERHRLAGAADAGDEEEDDAKDHRREKYARFHLQSLECLTHFPHPIACRVWTKAHAATARLPAICADRQPLNQMRFER